MYRVVTSVPTGVLETLAIDVQLGQEVVDEDDRLSFFHLIRLRILRIAVDALAFPRAQLIALFRRRAVVRVGFCRLQSERQSRRIIIGKLCGKRIIANQNNI